MQCESTALGSAVYRAEGEERQEREERQEVVEVEREVER